VLDLLMLILLFGAFAGAAAYVRACLNVTRQAQQPERFTR
jgi:hypothetical protein